MGEALDETPQGSVGTCSRTQSAASKASRVTIQAGSHPGEEDDSGESAKSRGTSGRLSKPHLKSASGSRPETALDDVVDGRLVAPILPYDSTGAEMYLRCCVRQGAAPSKSVFRQLGENSEVLDMSFYHMGTKGLEALAMALTVNTTVTTLVLNENSLDDSAIATLCNVLPENIVITTLILSNNNITGTGLASLASFLQQYNQTITNIDLSANNFNEEDVDSFCLALANDKNIVTLSLARNYLQMRGVIELVNNNEEIQDLDISWNNICGLNAREFGKALKCNITLKKLNLGWNGVSDAHSAIVADALANHPKLLDFDISANRITSTGWQYFAKALLVNEVLTHFRFQKNRMDPITDGNSFLKNLAASETSQLVFIDFTDMHFPWITSFRDIEKSERPNHVLKKKFSKEFADFQEAKPDTKITFGYTDMYGLRKLYKSDPKDEALFLIKKHCDKTGMSHLDLFAEFDEDGSNSVSYDEFRMGLKSAKLGITDEQITALIQFLDADGDGDIDFAEFVIEED